MNSSESPYLNCLQLKQEESDEKTQTKKNQEKQNRSASNRDSNKQQKRREKQANNIKKMVLEFQKKYFLELGERRRQEIINRIMEVKYSGVKIKYIEMIAYAALYFQQFKGSKKYLSSVFCNRNGLSVKNFNKAIFAYARFYNFNKLGSKGHNSEEDEKAEAEGPQCKIQVKEEEEGYIKPGLNSEHLLEDQHISQSFFEVIDSVFDNMFKQLQIQDQRRKIIMKLIDNCCSIYSKVAKQMTWTNNSLDKKYHILFIYLKRSFTNVTFYDYKKIAQKSVGLQLSKSHHVATLRLVEDAESRDEAAEEEDRKRVLVEQESQVQYRVPNIS